MNYLIASLFILILGFGYFISPKPTPIVSIAGDTCPPPIECPACPEPPICPKVPQCPDLTKGLNNVSVMVKIKEQTSEGQYNDSLYYPLSEWNLKTVAEIKAVEQARVDKWLYIIKNPPPYVEPTKEELQTQADGLQRQLDEINAQILTK